MKDHKCRRDSTKTFSPARALWNCELPKIKMKGFTLAEVLITLGIIGIVAAMTMPALMTNMRHKIASARLKKFYSTMKQTLLLSQDENGDVYSWDRNLSFSDFYDIYFLPYIKAEKGKTYQHNDTLFFPDGSSFRIEMNGNWCRDTVYDYNGKKGPNTMGYDRFKFLICSDEYEYSKMWCPDGFCGYFWNIPAANRTHETLLNKCRSNAVNASYCSGLLQIDHWEFLSDYPY